MFVSRVLRERAADFQFRTDMQSARRIYDRQQNARSHIDEMPAWNRRFLASRKNVTLACC